MRDISDARLIHLKGGSFLLIGLLAAALLLFATPTAQTAVLLCIAIWGFCRFYYYAFYVITHYVDPSFRFSGLGSFARYLLSRRQASSNAEVKREERD